MNDLGGGPSNYASSYGMILDHFVFQVLLETTVRLSHLLQPLFGEAAFDVRNTSGMLFGSPAFFAHIKQNTIQPIPPTQRCLSQKELF